MNQRTRESPRFSATGLATGSILATVVAMAVSLVFDIQPADTEAATHTADSNVTAHA